MSVRSHSISTNMVVNREYMPAIRYAFGTTLIMSYAMGFGGYLAYLIPFLALNFLSPGTKMPTFKQGVSFVLMVAVTSFIGFLFTAFLYNYTWVFIPLLGLILFYLYYTTQLTFMVKLFLLISLLAYPVPSSGMDPTVWAYLVANTLVMGSVFSILMVWIVYGLFPDRPESVTGNDAAPAATGKVPGQKERFNRALEIFLVTFPVVLLFFFFQWSDALLVLVYVVVLSMLPDTGKTAGKVKIYGNLIGGVATLIFYELIVIVPNFFFFILLILGTALFFADKIFSGKPVSALYKTGFSALVLLIGSISTSTDTAGSQVWSRVILVMCAVFYVVLAFKVVENFKSLKEKRRKYRLENV